MSSGPRTQVETTTVAHICTPSAGVWEKDRKILKAQWPASLTESVSFLGTKGTDIAQCRPMVHLCQAVPQLYTRTRIA